MSGELLFCYNRGCGQKFDPNQNTPESCRHHSGHPVFHDAYKGWSCCKKKCTDFTEFLNIKGCTVSYHNNVKPAEPEKPVVDKSSAHEIIEVRAPVVQEIERPPFNTPLVRLIPDISPSLKDALLGLKISGDGDGKDGSNEVDVENIPIGTDCKNNACKAVYEGIESLSSVCTYHPGYPVFHEGLKFWSCCTKRTTDFDTFLSQVGCSTGSHVWLKKKQKIGEVKCRVDWHQTGSHVFVSIFGKKCDPDLSVIEISPVRLRVELNFPEQGGIFSRDMELAGVVNVEGSSVSMYPSKVEIKLKKLGVGSWSKLEIRRLEPASTKSPDKEPSPEPQVESVDLNFI